jgi:hypothetical protein
MKKQRRKRDWASCELHKGDWISCELQARILDSQKAIGVAKFSSANKKNREQQICFSFT